jgi:diphthine-ammonia ligase
MDYDGNVQNEDEVEDLYALLKLVLEKHPDIQGVSSGAIMSTYQKNRVEHICERLGLTSVALLWELNQKELLDAMIKGGMNSILIKVACYGLSKQHIGMTLAEIQPTMNKLSDEFGVHCCGEGGEFESLTLDCPLYKKRIVM